MEPRGIQNGLEQEEGQKKGQNRTCWKPGREHGLEHSFLSLLLKRDWHLPPDTNLILSEIENSLFVVHVYRG